MLTESLESQLLDKIDEDVTDFYDPIIEPAGNDNGAIRKAIKFLLTCDDKDLASNRLALQQAYIAYFKIEDISEDDLFDVRTTLMSRDQIAANDAGVDGRYFA